jgi:cellulose synthase/poly-beta-1,6-N-acetylglucosamine synthase-like glycosyltransferase
VIVANDDSTDRTAEIVREFGGKHPNIRLLNVKDRDKAISPKKNALGQAIDASNGEIILSTDADCIVQNSWIACMVSEFEEETAMVAGFSRTRIPEWNRANLAQKFEFFDFAVLFITAAGAISSGKYFSCSGQNIAYTKAAFDQVDGFQRIRHLISGDDVNLMQLMRKEGMNVRFAFSAASFVSTRAVSGWKQLLNQRVRWASNSKWQLILNPEFFFYLVNIFILILLGIILFFHKWWIGLILFLLKLIPEMMLIKLGFREFCLPKNRLRFFPIWFVIQPFYLITVGVMGVFNLFQWHGRR